MLVSVVTIGVSFEQARQYAVLAIQSARRENKRTIFRRPLLVKKFEWTVLL